MAQRVEALVNGIDSQFCLSLQSALVVSSTPVQSTIGEAFVFCAMCMD